MRERLELLEPNNNAFVGTFHSFGVRIIRENALSLGLDRNFSILDSDDVTSIIKKIMKEEGYDPKLTAPSYIKNKISSIKNDMLTDSEIDKYFNTPHFNEYVTCVGAAVSPINFRSVVWLPLPSLR